MISVSNRLQINTNMAIGQQAASIGRGLQRRHDAVNRINAQLVPGADLIENSRQVR